MQTYLFRCPLCQHTFDVKRSSAEAGIPAAFPACGASVTTRMFTATTFFSPGTASMQLFESNAKTPTSQTGHAAGCPCCRVRPSRELR